jgi:hypothetical protein
MEVEVKDRTIRLNHKTITQLDAFVLNFISHLERHVDYVIISGYIPILFGRTRGTEDVDIFIRNIDKKTFTSFYQEVISDEFYFLNPEDENGLFEMLTKRLAIRAAKKNTFIPNIELKFIKDDIDLFTIEKKINLILNNKHHLYISPIEVEIPYKLYLGSEKDIEDALYLWDIFKDYLDMSLIRRFMKELNVTGDEYGITL